VDAEWANLLGRGIALGARYGRGTDIQETRASLFLPAIGRGGDFTGTVFRTQENFLRIREADLELIPGPAGPTTPGLFPLPLPPSGQDREVQQGFTLQQNRRLPKEWDVLLGYSFKRISSELVDFRQDISEVELSLIRDTRRDPLNAREGHFYSISVALGPEFLGSDFSFFRVYTQMVLARALGESLTWAHAYRVGLANGLDEQRFQQVEVFGRSTELFRAGGANSLRGFATDSVGPPGPLADVSVGGEVVVILNQELRYQHPSGLGAVAFYDGGNVFDRIEDVGFELRHSLGVGVRWESPVGLLRFDLGFPLNKRPTDRAYQWFFSLGQAF
jgi:outer membrane translocation and assembly module TamA